MYLVILLPTFIVLVYLQFQNVTSHFHNFTNIGRYFLFIRSESDTRCLMLEEHPIPFIIFLWLNGKFYSQNFSLKTHKNNVNSDDE